MNRSGKTILGVLVLALLCYLFFQAFRQERVETAVLNEIAEKRISIQKKKHLARCQRDMIADANIFVDSLMLLRITQTKSDTLPDKPIKPAKPNIKRPDSEVPIEPFIKKER